MIVADEALPASSAKNAAFNGELRDLKATLQLPLTAHLAHLDLSDTPLRPHGAAVLAPLSLLAHFGCARHGVCARLRLHGAAPCRRLPLREDDQQLLLLTPLV